MRFHGGWSLNFSPSAGAGEADGTGCRLPGHFFGRFFGLVFGRCRRYLRGRPHVLRSSGIGFRKPENFLRAFGRPLRAVLPFSARGLLVGVVLPLKRAIAAQGDQAERKQFARLFAALFQQRGPEPHGKFVDFEMQQLPRDVMPEFVYGDHRQQNGDGEHDAPHAPQHRKKA